MQSTREDAVASPTLHVIFSDLISALLSSIEEDLKPPILRSLYALLWNVTLRTEIGGSYPEVVSNRKNILNLSVILFNSLEDRFRQFSLAILDVSSNPAHPCSLDQYPNIEELTLLLRCCLALLTWLHFNQNLTHEKAKFLLSILSKLISFGVNGKNEDHSIRWMVRRECTYGEDGSTSIVEDFAASLCFRETSYPYHSSLCTLLEVFADELLAEESLGRLFVHAESALTPSERLFLCSVNDYHIEMVLEVMSAHLFLLVSDKQASEKALHRLRRWHCRDFRVVPELDLRAALTLLLNPIVLSAPKLFQAHVILLVSEAAIDDIGTELTLMDFYLAFEKSVSLYKQHMSAASYVDDDHNPLQESSSGSSSDLPPFSSCINQVTRGKLYQIIAESETLWDSSMQNMTSEDLLSASVTFLKEEDPYCLDKSCKDEIISVLIGLLTTAAFSDDHSCCGGLDRIKNRSSYDIYLLSSNLKLMSVSMFQFIGCLRCKGNELKDHHLSSSSKVYYNHLLVLLSCFQQYDVRLPVQTFLHGVMMNDHPAMRNKESSWMLLHFSGLLSLCFASRLDFLVKDCLSVMMAIMNLIAFEGDLSSLIGIGEKVLRRQKCSQTVAINFLRYQRHFSSNASSPGISDGRRIQEETESTDGKASASSNIVVESLGREEISNGKAMEDDLMEFVEFKEDKDYSLWSKNLGKYRKKKLDKKKKTDLRRKMKRKACWTMINEETKSASKR